MMMTSLKEIRHAYKAAARMPGWKTRRELRQAARERAAIAAERNARRLETIATRELR